MVRRPIPGARYQLPITARLMRLLGPFTGICACPYRPGGPTFTGTATSGLDTRDGLILGILREMEQANVWRETPEAAAAWIAHSGSMPGQDENRP